MGECLITRRGGEFYELPVLDENYPQDVTLTVIKGNTVSATFNAVFATHGKPAEYTYQWYVDGAAVEGANSAVFTMADLGETVNRSVYCEITNKAGTVTTRVASLSVTQLYTPELNADYPADVTLNDGSTTSATFNVDIAANGNPAEHTYQWYVNGEAVSGATSASYTRSNLVKYEILSVYCEVTNTAGTVRSRTATLSVKHTLLYKNGTRYDAVTGGITAAGMKWESGDGTAVPTVTYNSTDVNIGHSANGSGIAYFKNKLDLTNFKALHIKAKFKFVNNWLEHACVWSSFGTYAADNLVASYTPASGTSEQTKDINLNVSSVNGGHYIGFHIYPVGTLSKYAIWFYDIWLEGK